MLQRPGVLGCKRPSDQVSELMTSAEDEEQLVDLNTQYAAALKMIPELWKQVEAAGRDPSACVLELKDQNGVVLLSVPFTDVMAALKSAH
jgi:hypothetical protein